MNNDASGVVSIPEEEEEEEEDEGKRTEDEEDEMDDVEQYVQIRPSAQTQNEAICRVTCPDKTGLGADLARTIFDFGLVIVKGDFATDGQWAFVLLTIYAPPSTHELQQGGFGKKKKKKKSRKARRKSKKRAAARRGSGPHHRTPARAARTAARPLARWRAGRPPARRAVPHATRRL